MPLPESGFFAFLRTPNFSAEHLRDFPGKIFASRAEMALVKTMDDCIYPTL